MKSMEWLTEDEWKLCKQKMDQGTFECFSMEVRDQQTFTVGLPFPIIEILEVCEVPSQWRKRSSCQKIPLRTIFETYQKQGNMEYAILYQCLAFTLFGYGNWSNNQRRQKGLRPIRFHRP